MIGIDTVYDIHVVPQVAKSMRQAIDIHCIAAEAIGRIKGSEVAESERARHSAITFGMRFIICCAAASHESRLAALIPASRITLFHLAMSALMNAANSAEDPGAAKVGRRFCRNDGECYETKGMWQE